MKSTPFIYFLLLGFFLSLPQTSKAISESETLSRRQSLDNELKPKHPSKKVNSKKKARRLKAHHRVLHSKLYRIVGKKKKAHPHKRAIARNKVVHKKEISSAQPFDSEKWVDEVTEVLTQRTNQFSHCYQRGMSSSGIDEPQRVVLQFRVDSRGRASKMKQVEGPEVTQKLVPCFSKIVAKIHFPKPARTSYFQQPFRFHIEHRHYEQRITHEPPHQRTA